MGNKQPAPGNAKPEAQLERRPSAILQRKASATILGVKKQDDTRNPTDAVERLKDEQNGSVRGSNDSTNGDDAATLPERIDSSVSKERTNLSRHNSARAMAASFMRIPMRQADGSFVLNSSEPEESPQGTASNQPRRLDTKAFSHIYHGVGFGELPRGGYIVRTRSLGPIQFGIPPETIKDSLARGMSVPKHFVIQGEMFDRKAGLSKAEFEFPIYYQYFVARSRVNIITTKELEKRIRRALKETLIGPGSDCNVTEDYPAGTPLDALPNFEAEALSLDPERKSTGLDDVVRFTLFDESNQTAVIEAEDGSKVVIRAFSAEDRIKGGTKPMFEIKENDHVLAHIPAAVKLRAGGTAGQMLGNDYRESTRSRHAAKQQLKKAYEVEERLHLENKPRGSTLSTADGMRIRMSNLGSSQTISPDGGSIGNLNLNSSGRLGMQQVDAQDASGDPTSPTNGSSKSLNGSRSGVFQFDGPKSSDSTNVTNAPFRTGRPGVMLDMTKSATDALSFPSTPRNGAELKMLSQQFPKFAPFDIPVFGVTMMGASHGFDAQGRTTGFVLWMNRRGVMVDPPPDSSQILELMGVPPLAIEGVILTHTHADHDAGTFQRILRTKQIKLYATKTVERSFINKYSAITGFDASFLRSLFTFIPVQCGETCGLKINGGELRFFYSLHTIPCVGFEAYFGTHSLVYSADTRYDPELCHRLQKEGKIGKRRAEQLGTFPFNHTVILHELGVPPIHTPKETLSKAAFDEKHFRKGRPLSSRLFVVHSSEGAGQGFANQCKDWDTIRIAVEQGRSKQISEIISVLSNVEWLEPLGIESLGKLAKLCKYVTKEPGETVVHFVEDEPPESIYIVLAGIVSQADDEGELYTVGDSFGENGILADLEFGSSTGTRANVRRIIGVPLSMEILASSRNLVHIGRDAVSVSDESTSVHKRHTAKYTELPDFPAQTFRAVSRAYLVEIPNKSILKQVAKNKQKQRELTERLRRFNGWPNDGRWCALQRNALLMKLLSSQIAIRDFLENLSEDYITYPEGFVLEDGRSNSHPTSVYFIKEGVLRVTPMHVAFSFRATGETKLPGHNESVHPFECARGSLVGDFNALIKREKSPYRILCVEECEIYHIELAQLLKFFEEFPGIKFQLIDRVIMGWMLDVQQPQGEQLDLFGGTVVRADSKPF